MSLGPDRDTETLKMEIVAVSSILNFSLLEL